MNVQHQTVQSNLGFLSSCGRVPGHDGECSCSWFGEYCGKRCGIWANWSTTRQIRYSRRPYDCWPPPRHWVPTFCCWPTWWGIDFTRKRRLTVKPRAPSYNWKKKNNRQQHAISATRDWDNIGESLAIYPRQVFAYCSTVYPTGLARWKLTHTRHK